MSRENLTLCAVGVVLAASMTAACGPRTKAAGPSPEAATAAAQKALETHLSDRPDSYLHRRVAPYWPVEPRGRLYVNYTGGDASSLAPVVEWDTSDESDASTKRPLAIKAKSISIMADSLKKQGFRRLADPGYDGPDHFSIAYKSAGTLCTLEDPRNGSLDLEPKNGVATLSCGTFASYTPDMASYRKLKPFLDAYLSSGHKFARGDTFDLNYLKKSRTPGYEIAEFGGGNVGACCGLQEEFWRKDSGKWHFGTEDGPTSCTNYNTPVLKAAFKGEPCLDSVRGLKGRVG